MIRALYRMTPAPDTRAWFVAEGIVGLLSILMIVVGLLIAAHVATVQCASCGGV